MGFWQDKLQAIKKLNTFQKVGFVVVILFIVYSFSGGLRSITLNRNENIEYGYASLGSEKAITQKDLNSHLNKFQRIEQVNDDNTKTVYLEWMDTKPKLFVWIPGYNDSYYHPHIGLKLKQYGYDIIVVQFRGYDNSESDVISAKDSLILRDKRYNIDNIEKYTNDLQYIKNFVNDYDQIVFYGHSTGGLILQDFIHNEKALFKDNTFMGKPVKIVYNSPFWKMKNLSTLNRIFGNTIAFFTPNYKLKNPSEDCVNHQKEFIKKGGMKFPEHLDLQKCSPVHSGWFRQIILTQKKLDQGKLKVNVDKLVLISDRNASTCKYENESGGDCVLDVKDLRKYSTSDYLGGNVLVREVEDGTHDLFTGKQESIEEALFYMLEFIKK